MDWMNAVIQGVLLGGLYALFAAGLSLVFGIMRVVNLAHGDFIILAAFLSVVVVGVTGLGPFLSLVIVVPLMGGLGYAVQRGLLARTLDRGVLPPLLVTRLRKGPRPVTPTTTTLRNAARMMKSPCARLTTRMMPKTRESPAAKRAYSPPSSTPWITAFIQSMAQTPK